MLSIPNRCYSSSFLKGRMLRVTSGDEVRQQVVDIVFTHSVNQPGSIELKGHGRLKAWAYERSIQPSLCSRLSACKLCGHDPPGRCPGLVCDQPLGLHGVGLESLGSFCMSLGISKDPAICPLRIQSAHDFHWQFRLLNHGELDVIHEVASEGGWGLGPGHGVDVQ